MAQGPVGPPAPPRLLTVQSVRRHPGGLRIRCDPCGRDAVIDGTRLPVIPRAVAVGELWLAGRFRCAGCRRPASRIEVVEHQMSMTVTVERWGLGDPLVAERLRRHWRWDPHDRRDWPPWFHRR
jgi:hypothetical protein